MGRRAKLRKQRREAEKEHHAPRGFFLGDFHDGRGYVDDGTGLRRVSNETAAEARRLHELRKLAERRTQEEAFRDDQARRAADPEARAADDLVATMVPPEAVASVGQNRED